MVLTDDTIAVALNRIADGIEENNILLDRIANHYDGVVPVMTRNAKRVEKAHEKEDSNESLSKKIDWSIFKPQTI